MKIFATFYDVKTGDVVDRVDTTLAQFCNDNPNMPAQYVIREEMREIGAYITQSHGVRCEVTKQ